MVGHLLLFHSFEQVDNNIAYSTMRSAKALRPLEVKDLSLKNLGCTIHSLIFLSSSGGCLAKFLTVFC